MKTFNLILLLLVFICTGRQGTGINPRQNIYSKTAFGVSLLNSNAEIFNNQFREMISGNYHCIGGCGVGIYAESHPGIVNNLTIGGIIDQSSGIYKRNIFNNETERGILFSGDNTSVIDNNVFNSIGFTGIDIRNCKNSTINITNNLFTDVTTRVLFNNMPKCTLNICDNVFNNNNYFPDPFIAFYNTAITLQQISGGIKSGPTHVWNNMITDHRIGIHAMNLPGVEIGTNSLGINSGNTIVYNSPAITDFHLGIWLQQCDRAFVAENILTNDDPVTGITDFRGIDIQLSRDFRINCNTHRTTIPPFGKGINWLPLW